jgi:AraC family transcriptional regulator, regulatory protein of adaptative response / methylated-DNA-[protein]-cysteine methyltransferase
MNASQLSNTSTANIGETIHFAFRLSAIGQVLVAQSARGIRAVLLGTKTDSLTKELRTRFPLATLKQDDAKLGPAIEAVVAFIRCPSGKLSFPLDLWGSPLETEVWQAIREIPVGSTSTYLDIAKKVDATAQEVGQACAANALAVVVPCHRVIRTDGSLAGYRWGLRLKQLLLHREQESFPLPDFLS